MNKSIKYVGLDPAIRHSGVCISCDGTLMYRVFNNGVTLKSTVNEYLQYASDIVHSIAEISTYHTVLVIDFTTKAYRQRANQQALLSTFIGMIIGKLDVYVECCDRILLDPKILRSYVGLKPTATKEDVWVAYDVPDIEWDKFGDLRDAYALMEYGRLNYLNGYEDISNG